MMGFQAIIIVALGYLYFKLKNIESLLSSLVEKLSPTKTQTTLNPLFSTQDIELHADEFKSDHSVLVWVILTDFQAITVYCC